MDETTKILIGTISGFVIAFFAEPIKLFFQNAFKKRNLKTALYREMYNNYRSLEMFIDQSQQKMSSKDGYEFFVKFPFRKECFQYYISNQPELFYQLREAIYINTIYDMTDYLINLANQSKRELSFKEFRKMVISTNNYLDFYCEKGVLNKRTWDTVKGKYNIHI